jgi:hypothetical protein
LRNPISKKPITKRSGGMAQGIGPEFKSQYHRTKKKQPRLMSIALKDCTRNPSNEKKHFFTWKEKYQGWGCD